MVTESTTRSTFIESTFNQQEATMPFSTYKDMESQAIKKGDFQLARQILHSACEQLEGENDKQAHLIELMSHIADTYVNEANYELAKSWYQKALMRSESLHGTHALSSICLMSKLAQVNVLQRNMDDFHKYLNNLQLAYLLTTGENTSTLLDPLGDLSWALCVKGYIAEVKSVNSLIAQIKQLEEEYKLESGVA